MKGRAREMIDSFPERRGRDVLLEARRPARPKSWIKGRVVLLGDSACAFLPTAGIGASMAMESAAVLADELSPRRTRRTVPLALIFFERRRRARVEAAQDDSRKPVQADVHEKPGAGLGPQPAVRFMKLESLAKDIVKMLGEPI